MTSKKLYFVLGDFFPPLVPEVYQFDFGEGKKWSKVLDHVLGEYHHDLWLPGIPTNEAFVFDGKGYRKKKLSNRRKGRCPNRLSAWSSDVPVDFIPTYRCFCSDCLAKRNSDPRPHIVTFLEFCLDWLVGPVYLSDRRPVVRYEGSIHRCKYCGAVDGVPYPSFDEETLSGGKEVECSVRYGLCNRAVCLINRRFKQDIPGIRWTHDKGSYPSGCGDVGRVCIQKPDSGGFNSSEDWVKETRGRTYHDFTFAPDWINDPSETPIHKDLIDWAQDPYPSNSNSLKGWGRNTEYGAKVENRSKQNERSTSLYWRMARSPELVNGYFASSGGTCLDFGEPPEANRQTYELETYKTPEGWKTRIKTGDLFTVVNTGTRSPQIKEEIEANAKKSKARFQDYEQHPETISERRELWRTSSLIGRVHERWTAATAPTMDNDIDEVIAEMWEAEYRKKQSDPEDPDYLPPFVDSPDHILNPIRETTSTRYEIEEVIPLTEYVQWCVAIRRTFEGKSSDQPYKNGLYMLLKRQQQPPRVYLVFEDHPVLGEDFFLPLDWFTAACSVAAKAHGFSVKSFRGPCQVLRFDQTGAEIKVKISDWKLCGSGSKTQKQDSELTPLQSMA